MFAENFPFHAYVVGIYIGCKVILRDSSTSWDKTRMRKEVCIDDMISHTENDMTTAEQSSLSASKLGPLVVNILAPTTI